jgi:hypothetical protein
MSYLTDVFWVALLLTGFLPTCVLYRLFNIPDNPSKDTFFNACIAAGAVVWVVLIGLTVWLTVRFTAS